MPITALIYRSSHRDYSNGGVTAGEQRVLVIGPGEPAPDSSDLPVLRLKKRGGMFGPVLQPVDPGLQDPSRMVGPMMGGCYAMPAGGITQWERLTGATAPVAIHDRYETAEEYALLSS